MNRPTRLRPNAAKTVGKALLKVHVLPARFFGWLGRGDRLGPEIIPHGAMYRRAAKVYVLLFGRSPLDLFVAAKALRLRELIFQCLHHIRWNRLLTGIGTGLSDFLELLKAAFLVELKPIGNRVAMNAPQIAV